MSYLNTSFSYCGGRPDTFQILCHTRPAPRQNFDRPFERTTTCVFVAISQQKRLIIGVIIRRPKRETYSEPTLRAGTSLSRTLQRRPRSMFSEASALLQTKKNGQLIKAVRLRAENETRTRDPNLGKVVLYQLSYFRNYMFLPSCLAAVGNASRKRLNRRFGQGCALPTELFPQ